MKKFDKGKQTTHTNKYLQSPKPSFPWVYINQAAVAEKAHPFPANQPRCEKRPSPSSLQHVFSPCYISSIPPFSIEHFIHIRFCSPYDAEKRKTKKITKDIAKHYQGSKRRPPVRLDIVRQTKKDFLFPTL